MKEHRDAGAHLECCFHQESSLEEVEGYPQVGEEVVGAPFRVEEGAAAVPFRVGVEVEVGVAEGMYLHLGEVEVVVEEEGEEVGLQLGVRLGQQMGL